MWVGPVLLTIAGWQIWDAIEAGRVERAIARAFPEELVEQQESWELENAARYYVAASSAVIWPSDARFRSAGVTWGVREGLAAGESRAVPGSDEAFTLAVRNQLSLDLLERARDLPFGTFRPGTEFNYRFSGLLQVAQLATLRTLDLMRHGDDAAAGRTLAARMKFLRAFAAEGRLLGAARISAELQGIAIDAALLLGRTGQPDVILDELSRALDEFAVGDLDRFIRSESTGRLDALRMMIDGRDWSIGRLLIRPLARHHLAGMMQVTADARLAARLPWPERIAAMSTISARRSVLPEIPRFIAAWRLQLAFGDMVRHIGVGTAAARCARLTIAIERHRRSRGAFPQRLAELGWDGPDEILLDPFTGESLQYAPAGDGYALYSVGPDLTDDGGKSFPQPVSGRPPGTGPTPDVGVAIALKTSPAN